jgi:hypothetical protein
MLSRLQVDQGKLVVVPRSSWHQTAVVSDAWLWNSGSSSTLCCAYDELRNSLRPRRTMGEVISLQEQRQAFRKPLAALQTLIQAAS